MAAMINRKHTKGITLIELLVVLTIMAIVAVAGYPSYQTYLMETRRSDAITAIRENQLRIEEYFTQHAILPTTTQVTLLTASPRSFYTLTYERVNDEQYKITANADTSKAQKRDTNCQTIYITSELDTVMPFECK